MAHITLIHLLLAFIPLTGGANINGAIFQNVQAGPRNPVLENLLAQIPIQLPDGIDPKNINITSITVNTCTGVKEHIALLTKQLQEKTQSNLERDEEFSTLRRDVRKLKTQLTTCSSAASAVASSYQTHLQNKMQKLLETFDTETFLILKILSLTRDTTVLQKRISLGANQTQTEIALLKATLQVKTRTLNEKKQELKGKSSDWELILQIISLQNQIWELEQEDSQAGDSGSQQNQRLTALQTELDGKISNLGGPQNANSALLELITAHSKISLIQKVISVQIEKSQTNSADYERQLKQKFAILRGKIVQLNRDERNTELTNEILTLQSEMLHLRQLISSKGTEYNSQITDLRALLEKEKKKLESAQTQLEEAQYQESQMIVTIMTIMKELRELQGDDQSTKSTSQPTNTLQTLLETKEKEHSKAQETIKELERQLKLGSKCAGVEERLANKTAEFEQKIAKLKKTGDAKVALVLNVMNLHDELRNLRNLNSTTDDPQRKAELQRQLQEKIEELNTQTAQLGTLGVNRNTILMFIEHRHEILDLQKNSISSDLNKRVKELQSRVDGLIGELGGDDEKLRLTLKVTTLLSQVDQLQKELLVQQKLKSTELSQLQNELSAKEKELQTHISELNEKDETNGKLIMDLTGLSNQLRKLQEEKISEGQDDFVTIAKLKEELQQKVEEHDRDQQDIQALEKSLNETELRCTDFEQEVKDLQTDLDKKLTELQSSSDSVTSLIVQISTLTSQQEDFKRQLQNTQSTTKIKELQEQLEAKTKEITKLKEQLKAKSIQPHKLLQIITLQTLIEKHAYKATNETDYNRVTALQAHLNDLVEGIQDENNENTKLALKIFTSQEAVTRLERQKENEERALVQKVKDLEDELEQVRKQISDKTLVLDSSDSRVSNLSAQIMELHQKIKPLENEISQLKENHAEKLEELQQSLELSKKQLDNTERELKDADKKTYDLIMQIADLGVQLKKAKKDAAKSAVAGKNTRELEQNLKTEQKENRRLETENQDLKLEVIELKKCCSDNSVNCKDLQKQLEQSHADTELLEGQVRDRTAKVLAVQQELDAQRAESALLERKIQSLEGNDSAGAQLQQLLRKKDTELTQLQQELGRQTKQKDALQQNYNKLQNEKVTLENTVQELQNRARELEEDVIQTGSFGFDPETAHPRILLTEGNTKMATTPFAQNIGDSAGHFDVVLAALGETGFSSGKNYWEVSIADRSCYHVGMASESAPRKGSVRFAPSNGYWTIVRTKRGVFKALESVQTKIEVQVDPVTLGILLDYKRGQVSFYDAGRRGHLYSFQRQQFTDKMYAFVNYCVDDATGQSPITLLNPGSADWVRS